ncbi:hypothetical protein BsWGS_23250 [Bradybaena similaris]
MSGTKKEQFGNEVLVREPWYSEERPFNFTATGFLGTKRQEMLLNPLLLRHRIGRGRSSSDAIFGSNYRSPWTMAHALSGWTGVLGTTQKAARGSQKDNTDYMSLNRGAVSAAMVSSSDNGEFRKHKARIQQTGCILGAGGKRQERPLPKVFKPGTIFGRPPRYESIEALTSNSYQRQWLLGSVEGRFKKDVKVDYTKVRPTRASMLRPKVVTSGLQSQPWRSQHFIVKARPHLSTFRSEKSIQDAHTYQEIDSHGREGQTGQGILKNMPHEHPLPPMKGKCPRHSSCA